MERARRVECAASILLAVVLAIVGCSKEDEPPTGITARSELGRITKTLHEPSATAPANERRRMQDEAAARYAELVKRYPRESNVCAQALRSIGNIRASQTNIDDAVKHFAAVGDRYPTEDWEVLRAWKSAGDLLWDGGRTNDARRFYNQIVTRFNDTNAPAIYQAVVRGSKSRLADSRSVR
jgi:hypothetical protein